MARFTSDQALLPTVTAADTGYLGTLLAGFEAHLATEGKAQGTTVKYVSNARQFVVFLAENGATGVTDPGVIKRRDVVEFLQASAACSAPGTHLCRWAALVAFFDFLVVDNELAATDNPFRWRSDGQRGRVVGRPKPGPLPDVAVLPADTLDRLVAVCRRKRTMTARRDEAVLRIFWDSGARLFEVTNLHVEDVHEDHVFIRTGKGGDYRRSDISPDTLKAVRAYLRARSRLAQADLPDLWLGKAGAGSATRGVMTRAGIYDVVKTRGAEAGMPGIYPHQFRHTWADQLSTLGVPENSLMAQAGWKSRDMPDRYGRSRREERASEIVRRARGWTAA